MKYLFLLILVASLSISAWAEEESLNLSFEQLDNIFSEKGPLTDVQKENLWKEQFKGRYIVWEGKVDDVVKGWLGMAVHIKYLPSTTTHDVSIDFPKEQHGKLSLLKKGQKIKYKARLRSRSGVIMPYYLDDGKILTIYP